MPAARTIVARNKHTLETRADEIWILRGSRSADRREVTPLSIRILRRHRKARVIRVKFTKSLHILVILDKTADWIRRAHRRTILRSGQRGAVWKRGALRDRTRAIARTNARNAATAISIRIPIRSVHREAIKRETNDRGVMQRVSRAYAWRKLMRVIHATRLNVTLATVETRGFPIHRVAMPNVEIVVTHRIKRIEHGHAIDEHADHAERCSSR